MTEPTFGGHLGGVHAELIDDDVFDFLFEGHVLCSLGLFRPPRRGLGCERGGLEGHAAADGEGLAGDVGGLVGGEEADGLGDVFGLA